MSLFSGYQCLLVGAQRKRNENGKSYTYIGHGGIGSLTSLFDNHKYKQSKEISSDLCCVAGKIKWFKGTKREDHREEDLNEFVVKEGQGFDRKRHGGVYSNHRDALSKLADEAKSFGEDLVGP